jgi:hypothetical protein
VFLIAPFGVIRESIRPVEPSAVPFVCCWHGDAVFFEDASCTTANSIAEPVIDYIDDHSRFGTSEVRGEFGVNVIK